MNGKEESSGRHADRVGTWNRGITLLFSSEADVSSNLRQIIIEILVELDLEMEMQKQGQKGGSLGKRWVADPCSCVV